MPLVFGLGAPLVALVGTNIGAGQRGRALRVALTGGAIAFALAEAVGVAAALWPAGWLGLFSDDPGMLTTGALYLRSVGPAYGFFGLGLALYFASQGAGRLFWPLSAGLVRLVIAVGVGWVALRLTGSLGSLFAALALGLVAYGVILSAAIRSGAWFGRMRPIAGVPGIEPALFRGFGDRPEIHLSDIACRCRRDHRVRGRIRSAAVSSR